MQFKVGDTVRFRTEKDLRSNYENNERGIKVPGYVNNSMLRFCGETAKITGVVNSREKKWEHEFQLSFFNKSIKQDGWTITEFMLTSADFLPNTFD